MTDHPRSAVLLEERIDDVLLLTLNRPERHNALNGELSHYLGAAVARAPEEGIRVIVLTGAGEKSFCSGGDMSEMSGLEENAAPLPPRGERKNGSAELAKSPLPVLVAINGYCYGGGLRLALGCDIRLASDTSTFRSPGTEYGLVVGASQLPRLVGASRAKDWVFTARTFDAKEALEAGLVSSLHPIAELLPATLEMAHLIASRSAEAVQRAKRVIDLASLDDEAIAEETSSNNYLRSTPEQQTRFRDATRRVTGR